MLVNPYTKDFEHIKDVDQFFDYNPKTKEMVFNGESLVIYVPQRYEVYGMLTISDTITTLAICDLIINDQYQAGLLLPMTIEIEADDYTKVMVGEIPYIAITLSTGSRFITNTERIADSNIVYAIWMEFITRGKLIYNMSYDALSTLFDHAKDLCDTNINVDHVIFELIWSHLCRDPDNLAVQHRHTPMQRPFKFIALRNVGYATTSTTSRLLGSYFNDGTNSSLIQTSEVITPLEAVLRS